MKTESKIVQMINLMVLVGTDLTPEDKIRYDKSDNYTGLRDDESTNEELWGVALLTQVDVPELYEHMCYGIYLPKETQTSPHSF